VLVQTLASASETQDLLAIALAHDVVAGVVGWVDLERGDVAEEIERLRSLPGGEYLVGIRHLVQDEPDPRWLLREAVGRGIEALGDAGLVYDLLIRPAQTRSGARARLRPRARPFSSLTTARSPPSPKAPSSRGHARSPTSQRCRTSRAALRSGERSRRRLDRPANRPVHRATCSTASEAQRLLFGSDWPVCTTLATHGEVFELARASLAPASRRRGPRTRSFAPM